MTTNIGRFCSIVLLASNLAGTAGAATPQLDVASPGGTVRFTLSLDGPKPACEVNSQGRPVLDSSTLSMTVDSVEITAGARAGTPEPYRVDETYPTRGVHARAVNRCNGVRIPLEHAPSKTAYTLEVRAYDDGVAFRTIVPGGADAGAGPRVPDEATTLTLPAGSTVWSHGLRGHYEDQHEKKDVAAVEADSWAAPPLTFRLPQGGGYGSITEAALVNYSGMALQADGRRGYRVRLGHAHPASYPFTLRYGAAEAERLSRPAAIDGTITTPWRVVMIGADLDALVNCDLVANLCPAPDPNLFPRGIDTPWVKPGRAVWEYLDGRKQSLDEMKEYCRLAGELGFEYNVLEGFWSRWSDDELRGLIDLGRRQKVGLWLWRHSKQLRDPQARREFFAKCRDLGVAGVKLDFFDHEHKEVIDFYQTLLRECAEHHLMVNFHGSNKPAGESRTWPNELTREAVRGMENRSMKVRSRHDATLPFTRLLAGPADYTPVHFGERRGDTTWAHQIACAAAFTSPLLTYGASPRNLLGSPAVEMIRSIPATWEETRVLPGSEIGEVAAFARRSGSTWFVAILNGPAARSMTVSLSFLGPGGHRALLVRDRAEEPGAVQVETRVLDRGGSLTVDMAAGGGFVARLGGE
jgi:alpha-glucosidase